MTYKYLSDIKSFLEENVSPKIQLRGIVSGDDLSFEMVNPKITVGWPTTYDTQADVADKIPGIVVGLSAPIVYTQDSAVIPVELVAIIYCPGTLAEGRLMYDKTGYWDVCNLMDLIVREVFAADKIGSMYLFDRNVQCSPDNEQNGDYWRGTVNFTVKAAGVPELRYRDLC